MAGQETRARRKASQLCLSAEKLLHNLTQPIKGWSDLLPVMPKSAIKYSNVRMHHSLLILPPHRPFNPRRWSC